MRGLVVLAALSLAGCSILNEPDRSRYRVDAGPDSGRDGGPDAPDAPDVPDDVGPDAPDLGPGVETDCTNGRDDDEDGLTDCEDFDCTTEATCCMAAAGRTPIEETTFMSVGWESTTDMVPVIEEGDVIDFWTGAGFVHDECVPFGGGGTVSATFRYTATPCDGELEECPFARVTLSPVSEGSPFLPAELAVEIRGGLLRVTQEGLRDAPTSELGGEARDVAVRIDLRPGTRDGRAVLVPFVRTPSGGTIEGAPIDQRNLTSCGTLQGLRVAVEGRGTAVGVRGSFRVETQDCPNPSQFDRVIDDPLTAEGGFANRTSLGWGATEPDPDWANAWIGAPSLAVLSGELHVAGHASNHDPNIEPGGWVGTAIGHSEHNALDWASTPSFSGPDDEPRLGEQPPSCFGGCTPPRFKFREPHLSPLTGALRLFAARAELATDVYEIVTQSASAELDVVVVPRGGTGGPIEENCESLRDPFLAPSGDALRPWLFYTCIDGGRSSIRAARYLVGEREITGMSFEVLGAADDLAPFGLDVYSPELVVDMDGDDLVYRLWFLGFLPGSELAVGLAVTRAAPDAAELPKFTLYPANPVLRDSDPTLTTGCSECRALAQGFTVARIEGNRLRFLLARDLRTSDATHPRFEFLPLEQVWVPDSL